MKNLLTSSNFSVRPVTISRLQSSIINNCLVIAWHKVGQIYNSDSDASQFLDQLVKDGMWANDTVIAHNLEGEVVWTKTTC